MKNDTLFEPAGRLFFGDNLEVLRRHVADESVDLVYLDPPFNSNRAYNVLFAHRDGRKPAAQVKAFDDTWKWDSAAALTYHEVVEQGGPLSRTLRAFRELIGTSDMLAYLTMMAPRLAELHRALKPTGSLVLHCDPTASHYLKLLLDAVFQPEQFRNEIIWQRSATKGDARRKFGAVHDVLLFYGRSTAAKFHPVYAEPDEAYRSRFRFDDGDGRGPYRLAPLDSPSPRPNLTYTYKGYRPPEKGWRVGIDVMRRLESDGRLAFPKSSDGRIARKHYLNEQRGRKVGDVWTDVTPLQHASAEKLRYPTQKPLALLERIIAASTDPGDVVLDPFCGCGTTIDAAQRMGRNWVGIDITALAIDVIRERLKKRHPYADYKLTGEPSTIDEAQALWDLDPHEFERWVCRKLGIREATKKGADRGIDGEYVGVRDDGSTWRGIVSVKGGRVTVTQVRDLVGTITREGAELGVFVTLQSPTAAMRREAADAGYVEAGVPRIQILTVADLFDARQPALPNSASRPLPANLQRRAG